MARVIVPLVAVAFSFFLLVSPQASAQDGAAKGKALFEGKYGCLTCHLIAGKGGKIGPDLSKVGSARDGDYIMKVIKNPQSVNPKSMMPNQKISDEDAKLLTEFLLTLK